MIVDSTLATIQDIKFPTQEVGWILGSTSAPAAVVWTTYNGGLTWTKESPRIVTTPTYDRSNRIAFPNTPEFPYLANWAAIAGLGGNGTDGVIYLLEPRML
jgi:hypothetical protein